MEEKKEITSRELTNRIKDECRSETGEKLSGRKLKSCVRNIMKEEK